MMAVSEEPLGPNQGTCHSHAVHFVRGELDPSGLTAPPSQVFGAQDKKLRCAPTKHCPCLLSASVWRRNTFISYLKKN